MRLVLDFVRTFPGTTAAILVLLILLPFILTIFEMVNRIATRAM